MTVFAFNDAPAQISVAGRFDSSCSLEISAPSIEAIHRGALKLRIYQQGKAALITNASITLSCRFGNIQIGIGSDDSRVIFADNSSGAFDLRLWREASLVIGENTSSNGARIVCDRSEVVIGQDCMFSDGILIQSADQHGIVDLASGEIVNDRMRQVHVGDHVWLGRNCTLMPDVSIGRGAIVGAGAIVTSDVPEMTVAAGVPARVVKTGTTWSRFPGSLDSLAKSYVEQHR